MSLRKLPEAATFQRPQNYQWDAPADLLAAWAERPLAAETGDNVITMYEEIGFDYWTETGVTAKRVAGALRAIGEKEIVVKINSPGGDMFEGIAIYNLLRAHPAKVTVDVMGIAASAASIIAMAGDEIRMGIGTQMMIHNAWGGVVGNRHDMRSAADIFDGFDASLVDIYEARTGMKRAEIEAMMDAETFVRATEAVKIGFADIVAESLVAPLASDEASKEINAKRRLDASLAVSGMPRSERRRMIKAATGTHDAAGEPSATHDAGFDLTAARQFIDILKS